jgi:ATP-dependent Clp protease, protease subunit
MPKEIKLSGFVGDELTPEVVQNALNAVEGEDVIVQLNSPGGFVFDGMEIYNIISRFQNRKTVVLGGLVASIATYITAAFDEVIATESSAFMIHNAQDFAVGDYKELRKIADRTEKANDQIAAILAKRSGKSIDEIKDMMDAETWLYGQEIVDNGFADKLIESKDSGNVQPRDIAIEQAKNAVKSKLAAVYKSRQEFNAGNGIENINDGEESMPTKKEMLDKLVIMKESGELSLPEITDSFGLKDKLITEDHLSALKVVNALKEMNIDDPVKTIKDLQEKQNADADAVRNAKLSEVFGVSVKDESGKETNLVLAYAMNQVKNAEDLDAAIEAVKSDPIAIKLMEDKADTNSPTNKLGIVDKNKNGEPDKSGIDTVVL